MASNKPRFTITMPDNLYEKLEDFRFEKRFNTKSEATAELIRLGLDALDKMTAEEKQQWLNGIKGDKEGDK